MLARLVVPSSPRCRSATSSSGHRKVVCDQPGAISRRELEVFDRYFHDHPLVREHGRNPTAVTRRIEDLLPGSAFERTPLFNDYYRSIRIDHVMAVRSMSTATSSSALCLTIASAALAIGIENELRSSDRILAHLYRLSARTARNDVSLAEIERPLTAREHDVLDWLAAGKTDKDIAAILTISPRTIQKHLQRIYKKLG